jgi:hypothetical protein
MAAPAVQAALETVLASIEAITPTIDADQLFTRKRVERTAATTRAPKRRFDVDFGSMRDLSNEGEGVQSPGLADRSATFTIRIDYAAARSERALETTMAVDAELVLRALGRSANWAGTPVRRVVAQTAVERSEVVPVPGAGTATLALVVTAEITYRDAE